jgi:glutathione S-transferase
MRDIARVLQLWSECLTKGPGPFLFGDFSIADAFFAPVVLRFRGYDVGLSALPSGYQARMLAVSALQEWCAGAAVETEVVAADER